MRAALLAGSASHPLAAQFLALQQTAEASLTAAVALVDAVLTDTGPALPPHTSGSQRWCSCVRVPTDSRWYYTPCCALVEDTWFSPHGFQVSDGRVAIRAYMERRHGVPDFAIRFEERGARPMDPRFLSGDTGERSFRILGAGLARNLPARS